MPSAELISIQRQTFGNLLHDCTYSFLITLLVALCGKFEDAEGSAELQLFEEKELTRYDGIQKPEIYLSIAGNIFDVTEATTHYGPGSTYHIFVGRDNSRAFITGQFKEDDISDDILSLPPADVFGIQHWIKFYKKTYIRKGKLIGRYYDTFGKLTPYGKQLRKVLKQSEQNLANTAANKHRFPDCNVEWDPKKGSTFWCTNQSGGIKRDWEGLPKQLFLPGAEPRCACIPENEVGTLENIKPYQNCQEDDKICFIQTTEATMDALDTAQVDANTRIEL